MDLAILFFQFELQNISSKSTIPIEVSSLGDTSPPSDFNSKELFPYTGEGTNNQLFTRPAYMSIIENSPEARPQSGFTEADIVYEAMAEGGITRCLAIYQKEDSPKIGPVRSMRT